MNIFGGRYAQFFKEFMQQHVAASTKNVILLSHNTEEQQPNGTYKTFIKVKGSLMSQGVEAFMSIIVYTRVMPIEELEATGYDPELLHITDEDRMLGYKYVFQTRLTKDTVGSRIRSPMGLFKPNQTFMDNDVQLLVNYLEKYYNLA